jgi:hypothetical protein
MLEVLTLISGSPLCQIRLGVDARAHSWRARRGG